MGQHTGEQPSEILSGHLHHLARFDTKLSLHMFRMLDRETTLEVEANTVGAIGGHVDAQLVSASVADSESRPTALLSKSFAKKAPSLDGIRLSRYQDRRIHTGNGVLEDIPRGHHDGQRRLITHQ